MSGELSEIERLKILFDYWIGHNLDHLGENERWLRRAEEMGLEGVAGELESVVRLSQEVNQHIEKAKDLLGRGAAPQGRKNREHQKVKNLEVSGVPVEFYPIGTIRTPFIHHTPRQPNENDAGEFRVVVDERYTDGLFRLEKFKYICLFFFFHRSAKEASQDISKDASKDVPMKVSPGGTGGIQVGVFASRSPVRPNSIGFSVVHIKHISANTISTSCIDVLDKTPLLDIKPYISAVDSKPDAGNGWIEGLDDAGHYISHLKGDPHGH